MESLYDESLLITNGKKEKATDYIPEIDIYEFYWPEIKVGTQKNPFKLESKSPSFCLYYKEGKLEWKDQSGSGQILSSSNKGIAGQGDIFDFVGLWYKQFKDIELLGFAEQNEAIWRDMELDDKELINRSLLFTEGQMGPVSGKKKQEGGFGISVVDKGWTKWSLGYWVKRYGICPGLLEEYHCGHAKEVWVTPPGKATYLWGVSTESNPIFYFHFPRTGHVKCYAPFAKNKKNKWIMNCDNLTDIQGYHQLQIKKTRPKVIIFTKDMKEIMFYRSFHLDAIAIHGEAHRFHPDFIRHIKKYSDHQFSFYDNDWPGRKAAIRLQRDTGIEPFIIQGPKNITDLWEENPKAVWKYVDLLKNKYLI
jgi:hypothetical protein